MIKVGIVGADSPFSGELIRLLAIHPEVELKELVAPSLKGLPVASIHKGLIGEQDLRFCEKLDPENIDVLFLYLASDQNQVENSNFPDGLKVVDCNPSTVLLIESEGWVPGLSEMCRKPLVRGARKAFLLPSPTTVALIILYPLACHLLLNDTLSLKVFRPKLVARQWSEKEVSESVEKLLKKVQLSFHNLNKIDFEAAEGNRALKVEAELDTNISEEEIARMYEGIYDDHNFSIVVDSSPSASEVEGTQKCLIHIEKTAPDRLKVTGIADGVMRGGAGDALHVMNLLFGLFEKIGLTLPASNAFTK